MVPLDIETALDWRGRTVVDRDGDKVGTFDELYLDEDDRPAWGAVTTGLFGMRQTFVPLSEAQPEGDALRVPFDKDTVKDAPNVDPDTQLSAEELEAEAQRFQREADRRAEAAEAERSAADSHAARAREVDPDS